MKTRTLCVLSVLALAGGMALFIGTGASTATEAVTTVQPSPAQGGSFTFEGCWQPRSSTQCYDIFRDSSGGYWICKECGTTGKPSKGKCDPISQQTLDSGLWCS